MTYHPNMLYDGFFYATIGFIAGTVLGAYALPLYVPACAYVGMVVWKRKTKNVFILCVLACATTLLGSLYYSIDDYHYQQQRYALSSETVFVGTVTRVPRERSSGQSLFVTLPENAGNILVYTPARTYRYGDVVHVNGTLTPPPYDSYGTYLAHEHVSGTVFTDDVTVRSYAGNPFLARLFLVRESIRSILATHFTYDAYALIAAILIGDRDHLSPTMNDQLSMSGTLHVTALSGAHITIITFAIMKLCAIVFPMRKKISFCVSMSAVFLFVAMTGFAVSAVRAALMALAAQTGVLASRKGNPRNVIALTALILTLIDPKTPALDIGFQLSCLATIGIIYGTPFLQRWPFFSTPGIAAWRYVLAATIAAHVFVFPITVNAFQNFSFISLVANIAIVFVMPLLTIGGFVFVIATALFAPLGHLLSPPLSVLLAYTQHTVALFASLTVPFNPSFSTGGVLAYYGVLIATLRGTRQSGETTSRQSLP